MFFFYNSLCIFSNCEINIFLNIYVETNTYSLIPDVVRSHPHAIEDLSHSCEWGGFFSAQDYDFTAC
ncbi:hypothetical protein FKM82_023137 [Ascaphus truei]